MTAMNATTTTVIEPGNRIQLPAEWTEALGLQGLVVLDKTGDGILVRPHRPATWDEIFANPLPIGQLPPEAEDFEVSKDDVLF
jgi:hypothetical protein